MIQIAQAAQCFFRLAHLLPCFQRIFFVALHCKLEVFQSPLRQIPFGFCAAQRTRCFADQAIGIPPRITRFAIRAGLLGQFLCQCLMRGARGIHAHGCAFQQLL